MLPRTRSWARVPDGRWWMPTSALVSAALSSPPRKRSVIRHGTSPLVTLRSKPAEDQSSRRKPRCRSPHPRGCWRGRTPRSGSGRPGAPSLQIGPPGWSARAPRGSRTSPQKPRNPANGRASKRSGLKGLEPSTFCMASRRSSQRVTAARGAGQSLPGMRRTADRTGCAWLGRHGMVSATATATGLAPRGPASWRRDLLADGSSVAPVHRRHRLASRWAPSRVAILPAAAVAQLARASACHAEGRGFESLQPLSESPAIAGLSSFLGSGSEGLPGLGRTSRADQSATWRARTARAGAPCSGAGVAIGWGDLHLGFSAAALILAAGFDPESAADGRRRHAGSRAVCGAASSTPAVTSALVGIHNCASGSRAQDRVDVSLRQCGRHPDE